MDSDTLREKFLEFFRSRGHKIVDSDSLIPKDDPTVLFTSAGMNQFKKNFLGIDKNLKCAASCQKCLRTDDLDKVGKTTGHHTFFEMLGNFSFGDYFKKEAIIWAWEFLTKELNIPLDKLWVSVYKEDREAYDIWLKEVGLPKERIIKLGDKENFWPSEAKEKGPNGPCGPCSEIFYDWGKNVRCRRPDCNPSCDCGRFVEVWNLVFTQFNRKEGGILEALPQKNIDTGMGLERLAAVMQGVMSNFQTDLFQPIVKEILRQAPKNPRDELLYAVSDHIRAVVFAIADGILPSNEERGYVVRKLIRRSSFNLKQMGVTRPVLHKLVPLVAEVMKKAYPELKKRQENIAQIVLSEDKKFLQTLNSLSRICSEKFQNVDKDDVATIGKVSFELYDTYGIPIELTEDWLRKQGFKFLMAEFEHNLSRQRKQSRQSSVMKGEVFSVKNLNIDVEPTDFVGYDSAQTQARVLKILKGNRELTSVGEKEEAMVILDKTPFYPTSGGQVSDKGEFVKEDCIFEVKDVQKVNSVIIHYGSVVKGSLRQKDMVLARIGQERRLAIARNHTATHILQSVLRQVLGEHVQQQGSYVGEEGLRFDFTHFEDIDQQQLLRIEELVNRRIMDNVSLKTQYMSQSEAKKSGALAFFGEKYSDRVRVVTIGDFSKELCGGTHLDSTGQVGLFKIICESSIAGGIRRIEAETGFAAYNRVRRNDELLRELSHTLKVPVTEIISQVERLKKQVKDLNKRLNSYRLEIFRMSVDRIVRESSKVKDFSLICQRIDYADMELLRLMADILRDKTNRTIILLASTVEGKVMFVLALSNDAKDTPLDASRIIKELALIVGGSGGGRKDFAQAGSRNPEAITKAFSSLPAVVEKYLK